jgi:hypothetical protein
LFLREVDISKLFIFRSVYVIFAFGLVIIIFGPEKAYSQCNVLCMHERGDVSAVKGGLILDPSYEVALDESDYAQTEAADDNLLLAAEDAGADTTYVEAPSNKWHFAIIPYLWMMGINGKTAIKGRTANVDVTFSDIFTNLDFAAEVHIEAWRDRFGFFIDTSFAKIALKKDVDLRFDNTLSAKFISKFFLGEFGGFYRAGTWPIGSGTGSYENKTNTSLTLDLIGGGRYWYLKNEVDLKGPVGLNPNFSQSENWFDFIVGGRANLAINKFFIQLRSDIGGFGLGFSSDISWNIAGYIGYELPHGITPIIGYRALYDKYSNGSGDNRFLWDAWIYGPQIGVGFQF